MLNPTDESSIKKHQILINALRSLKQGLASLISYVPCSKSGMSKVYLDIWLVVEKGVSFGSPEERLHFS